MKIAGIPKEDFEAFYCLTWSFRQGAFHVVKLLTALEIAREAYLQNQSDQDYIIIDVSTSDRLLKKRRDDLIAKAGLHPPTQKPREA